MLLNISSTLLSTIKALVRNHGDEGTALELETLLMDAELARLDAQRARLIKMRTDRRWAMQEQARKEAAEAARKSAKKAGKGKSKSVLPEADPRPATIGESLREVDATVGDGEPAWPMTAKEEATAE